MYVYAYVCICMYMHMYVYVCICICMYMYAVALFSNKNSLINIFFILSYLSFIINKHATDITASKTINQRQ